MDGDCVGLVDLHTAATQPITQHPVFWVHQHLLLFSPVRRIPSVRDDVMGLHDSVAAVLGLIPWPQSWHAQVNEGESLPNDHNVKDADFSVVPVVHRWLWSAVTQTVEVKPPATVPVDVFESLSRQAASSARDGWRPREAYMQHCAIAGNGSGRTGSEHHDSSDSDALDRLCQRWLQSEIFHGIVQRASDERTFESDATAECRANLTTWLNAECSGGDSELDSSKVHRGQTGLEKSFKLNGSDTLAESAHPAVGTSESAELPTDWKPFPRVFHIISLSHNRSQVTLTPREADVASSLLRQHPLYDVVVWYLEDGIGSAEHDLEPVLPIFAQWLDKAHVSRLGFAFNRECECAANCTGGGDSEKDMNAQQLSCESGCASVDWQRYAMTTDPNSGASTLNSHVCFFSVTPEYIMEVMRTVILYENGGAVVSSSSALSIRSESGMLELLDRLPCGVVPPLEPALPMRTRGGPCKERG